jgi:PAS domain S-box-containing protein
LIIDGETLLDGLAVAAYVTDPEGRITHFNDAAVQFWGRRPAVGEMWCGSLSLFDSDGKPMPHDNCPMAVALKTGVEPRGVEAIVERPDGTRVRFMPHPKLLRDKDQKVVAAINVLIDISDLRTAEIDSARLAAIVTSSDDAIVSKTLDGIITSWNAGAERIFGYTEQEMIGRPIATIIPPELLGEEAEIIRRLRAGERIEHFETIRIAKGGRRLDISLTVSPMRDKSGRIVGASKVARDITPKKRAEKLQMLLIGELHHRVRNTLATVQAVATQSLRHSETSDAFVAGFTGRLASLSKAHGLLSDKHWEGAELHALVHDQVMFGIPDDDRVSSSGPPILLPSQLALHLSLVLHELGTNARKHGALSTPSGRIAIDWRLDGQELSIEWVESGGAAVVQPERRGLGLRLVDEGLKGFGGTVSLGFAPSGLIALIRVNLPEKPEPVDADFESPLLLAQS